MARKLGESQQRQRRSHDQDQDELPHIPSELAVEILVRLPIKSLLRFRGVSKSWKSFLDSKYFIDLHLRRRPPPSDDDDLLVAAVIPFPFAGMNVVDKASFTKLFEFNPPEAHNMFMEIRVVGTCNGLLCIQTVDGELHLSRTRTEKVYLWNPVRGVHTCIDTYKSPLSELPFTNYGFGYDSCNNEYKVVKFQHPDHPSPPLRRYPNKVYTLSTNSWRTIQSTPSSTSWPRLYKYSRHAIPPLPLVNGATHWLADSTQELETADNGISRDLVISFSFHDEAFREIWLPISLSKRYTTLVSYKNFLAVMVPGYDSIDARPHDNWTFHLWVMKEYGVAESWAKLYTIDPPRLNVFAPKLHVQFGGFGEDENELAFSVTSAGASGAYFLKINCNSSPQPTIISSSARFLHEAQYAITFRPSLVNFSTDVDIRS